MAFDPRQLGTMFQGAAAGLQGNTAGFQQQLNRQRQIDLEKTQAAAEQQRQNALQVQQQTQQQAEMDNARRKTLFSDAQKAQNILESGSEDKWQRVVKLGEERLAASAAFPGADFSDTQQLVELAKLAPFDERAAQAATDTINNTAQTGLDAGILESRQPEKIKKGDLIGGNLVERINGEIVKTPVLSGEQSLDADYQFGSSELLKDDNGNLFTQTQRRDKASGSIESVVVPLDGDVNKPKGKLQRVGTYGLTAQERLSQTGAEESIKGSAKEIVNIKKSGLKARGQIENTERLLKLSELINTGKTAPARKAFADLFNLKSESTANLGEFNSRAGKMVLGMIRMLGANPTEAEREFLISIGPSMKQAGVTNTALLRDILEVQRRQVERAKFLAKNPGSSLDDLLLLDDTPFVPTSQREEVAPQEGAPPSSDFSGFKVLEVK